MKNEQVILCGASSYTQKYYLNPDYEKLPSQVKDELKIMCVLFTEEVGGVLTLVFNAEGDLEFKVETAEADYLFDEIGCGLKMKEIQTTKKELLEGIQMYHKLVTGKANQ
ncbi:MAG: hypothetical protein IJW18_00870 [Lachnospiraceae bacterium]|nr:hypothetical protein [Lachnospiraceae bacterium]